MSLLRFSNLTDFIELDVSVDDSTNLQSRGDAYFTLKIQSRGFQAQNSAWVQADEVTAFCKCLAELERMLLGEAALQSISPNELALRIFTANSRGHLAIEGSTGHHFVGENRTYWHSLAFGFEFEPSQLSSALKSSWVQRYL